MTKPGRKVVLEEQEETLVAQENQESGAWRPREMPFRKALTHPVSLRPERREIR